jgi:Zn finger protein HypA/HybF involved in hydrogenase expression
MDEDTCMLCNGKRTVPRIEFECNASTGYQSMEHPTGEFDSCPNCGEEDIDTQMDDDDS